jgi:hypothetical protein
MSCLGGALFPPRRRISRLVTSERHSCCYLSLVDENHAGGGLLPRDLVRLSLALWRDASAMASPLTLSSRWTTAGIVGGSPPPFSSVCLSVGSVDGVVMYDSYLVDPASSHMLVSKIKPCMSKHKPLHGEAANGSLGHP